MNEQTPTPGQVLALEIGPNDSGAPTVRGYLLRLLANVWRDGEGFNGKRPFGNSGWEYDLYRPLVKAGFVPGSLDEDGYIDRVDERAADALVLAAIDALGTEPAAQEPQPALAVAVSALEDIVRKIDTLVEPGPGADQLSHIAHAALGKIEEMGK